MVGDADLKINGALKQTWQMKKYSYTDTVRQEHGLLYLRNGKIVYTWDNGRIEVFPGETVYLPKNSRYEAAFIGDGTAPAKDYLINFPFWAKTARVAEIRKKSARTAAR